MTHHHRLFWIVVILVAVIAMGIIAHEFCLTVTPLIIGLVLGVILDRLGAIWWQA